MSAGNDLDSPTTQRERKLHANLTALCALQGLALFKGDPALEEQAPYMIANTRAGVQTFDSLDAVREHLSRVDEAGHGGA